MNSTKYKQGTLQSRLQTKASMIAMGERIEWGSDSALMWEAAVKIEALEAQIEGLQSQVHKSSTNPPSLFYAVEPVVWCAGCSRGNCTGCSE